MLFGYGVSSLARPLVAIATTWTQVLSVRTLDRVGKGIRGAPRDAMLAAWATPDIRGRVFGFHRGMDHLGAVAGPLLATLFLLFYPEQYRMLFALTIAPGALAVALILLISEDANPVRASASGGNPRHPANPANLANPDGSGPLPRSFTQFMVVLGLFTLGNSTDAFLLLRLTDAAGSVRWVPLMWAALHVVKASVSMAAGSWSDRIGRRTVIATGWLIYAVVYGGFAISSSPTALVAWFMVYGFYFGFAEGAEKVLIADLALARSRGLACGVYNAVLGFGGLGASVMFGLIWKQFGAPAAFGFGGALALLSTALLFVVPAAVARPEPRI